MPTRRLAILVPERFHHDRLIASGAIGAARRRGWAAGVADYRPGGDPAPLAAGADAILIHAFRDDDPLRAGGGRVPVVNVGEPSPHAPRVAVDQVEIGRLAAQHLHAAGYPALAYFGFAGESFSVDKERGFSAAAAASGRPCLRSLDLHIAAGTAAAARRNRAAIRAWLAVLPRPVGICAVWDPAARVLADLGAEIGARIPQDIGLIGVNDDADICRTADPPLSSIALPGLAMGVRAVSLLDDLLRGRPVPADALLPPEGVVIRASSAPGLLADPRLAAVLRQLDRHLAGMRDASDLARRTGLNRRTMERLMRLSLGRSPAAEMRRRRVELACERLRSGDGDLRDAARAAGFPTVFALHRAFRAELGTAPLRWRRTRAGEGDAG